jgi:hypothetical protein
VPRPLQSDALEQNLRDLRIVGRRCDVRGKQFQLVAFAAVVEDVDRLQPPRLGGIIQFAEMTERPLTGAIRRAQRFDERPVGVSLPIFLAMIGAEKHWRPMVACTITGRKRVGLHYIANWTTSD